MTRPSRHDGTRPPDTHMGGVPEPERPTGWMRVVLGLVLAAIAWWTALPIILIVALLVAFGLTCGAALSLERGCAR